MRDPRPTHPTLLLLVLLAVAGTGCATGGAGPGGNPFQGGGDAEQAITFEIENNNFNDATIWALSSSGSHRLGTVSGKSERSFDLDWRRAQRVRLRIRIQAGQQCETRDITTDPGETLHMTIPVNFGRTRVCR